MKLRLLFFERSDSLYRGYGPKFPRLIWLPREQRWGEISVDWPADDQHSAVRLSDKEAERCYPGCTGAQLPKGVQFEKEFDFAELVRYRPDLFDDYDFSIRRSPGESLIMEKPEDKLPTGKQSQ